MLDWYKDLYIGSGIRDSEKIITKLNNNKLAPGVFLVTLSENPDNMLEIFSAVLLKQDAFRRMCPPIVGLAKGKDEAIELVQQMIQDAYQETGTYQVAEYLKNR